MTRAKSTPNVKRSPVQKKADNTRLRTPLEQFAGHKVMRLLGYWVLVQTFGGWEGVARQPFYSEGTIQRWRLEFREVFGVDAEDYTPEVAPVLRTAFYGGPEDTWDSEIGQALQAEATVVLSAEKVARRGGAK